MLVSGVQHLWFGIYIHYEMIAMVSLVTICAHTVILILWTVFQNKETGVEIVLTNPQTFFKCHQLPHEYPFPGPGSRIVLNRPAPSVSFGQGQRPREPFSDRWLWRQWQTTWISGSSLNSCGSQTSVFVRHTGGACFAHLLPEKLNLQGLGDVWECAFLSVCKGTLTQAVRSRTGWGWRGFS